MKLAACLLAGILCGSAFAQSPEDAARQQPGESFEQWKARHDAAGHWGADNTPAISDALLRQRLDALAPPRTNSPEHERLERVRRARAAWKAGGVYDKLFTPEELLSETERISALPPAERQKALDDRAELNRLWAAARDAGGDYDQHFAREELQREIAEVKALPIKDQKAALKSRIELSKAWNAGVQASRMERERQRQQAQAEAAEAFWVRRQNIEDQVEINQRTIDYLNGYGSYPIILVPVVP